MFSFADWGQIIPQNVPGVQCIQQMLIPLPNHLLGRKEERRGREMCVRGGPTLSVLSAGSCVSGSTVRIGWVVSEGCPFISPSFSSVRCLGLLIQGSIEILFLLT